MMQNFIDMKQGRRLAGELERYQGALGLVLAALAGFLMSAAALNRDLQPIAMGLCCAVGSRWQGIAIALGASAGYVSFWGTAGVQGLAWMIGGLLVGSFVSDQGIAQRQKLLIPALAALITAGCGVLFQRRFQDQTTIGAYLLRVASASVSAAVFQRWRMCPGTAGDWLAQGLVVLALAQVAPMPFLDLGYIAAGFLGASGGFPAAALAGVALDLARITPVPMTAAMSLGFLLRLLPAGGRWFAAICPALGYVPMALLTGRPELLPLPGLLLGGVVSGLLPGLSRALPPHRRGETAAAQVRLEQLALVFGAMEESLLIRDPPLESGALVQRAVEDACGGCPERRGCKARALAGDLPPKILEQPELGQGDLPPGCRKSARLMRELHRGQEQLRRMKAQRRLLEDHRTALREQLGYAGLYLQGLSDELSRSGRYRPARFRVEVGISARSRQAVNGDVCCWFSGTENQYFVLLCDGMGTGADARRESLEASAFLKRLLTLGLPAEYALRTLNSMAVLREKGACATVDLLRIQLDTGRAELYKWGAAPSYLLHRGQMRKIGTAGPPPGLSQRQRETVDRLSLSGGEALILLSDGAGEEILPPPQGLSEMTPLGEMAAGILKGQTGGEDDATAVVVRLKGSGLPTQ